MCKNTHNFFFIKMPRIDPQKLLSCIGVLLSPNGGIRSATEVKRLASLMTKYSKKLVSKCIYIQILKCTETDLLGQFMGVGGWMLAYTWLNDGYESQNWALVQELLELLLLCPVDVPRLQSNAAPKLVKTLSREEEHEGVRILASKLVEQWLKIAKGETMTINNQNSNIVNKENLLNSQSQNVVNKNAIFNDQNVDNSNELNSIEVIPITVNEINDNDVTDSVNVDDGERDDSQSLVFKIKTSKDGKQTVIETSPKKSMRVNEALKDSDSDDRAAEKRNRDEKTSSSRSGDGKSSKSSKDREREKSKDGRDRSSSHDKHKKSSSSSSSSHKSGSHSSKSSSSSSSKHSSSKSSSSSSSSKSHKSSSSSSSHHSSKDKDKHKSSSSSKSSSSRDKEKRDDSKSKSDASKLSQAEKDKNTLAKVMPPAIGKIGKIPKKPSTDDGDKTGSDSALKKKSISIEVRKDAENRPKTVKTYNSQFRSHGLEGEAPPPPSRKDLKKPATTAPATGLAITTPIPKRSLSPPNTVKESDKKIKLATTTPAVEKPGAIKLIPAKPKPSVLIESDMFMDAISAATNKKEVRKRKRIPSTKESENVGDKATSKEASKGDEVTPLRFYQDTLEENEGKDDSKSDAANKENNADDGETKEKKVKKEDGDDEEKIDDKSTDPPTEDSPEEPAEEVKREPGIGCGPDGPPGVLTLHRRKGPKKKLTWRPQETLEEVRFFELDETERVNVTKTFVDMKQMERVSEREAFLISRKQETEDIMVEQMTWQPLIEVEDVPEQPTGTNSKERAIQTEREKTCLKTIYFNRAMIPDSPSEPDVIAYQNVEPQTIPLFDVTGNPDAVHDFTNMPWPEPKASPPHQVSSFDEMTGVQNFPSFNQFNSVGWPMGQPPNMPIRPPQMAGFNQMMPPDAMGMNPMQQFNAANMNPLIPPPFAQNNLGFMNNFGQPMPPMMGDNRPGRNNMGNWFGNNGGNNWQTQGGGNNNNNNQRNNWVGNNRRICKQFQRGFCKLGNNCKFLHPGANNRPHF